MERPDRRWRSPSLSSRCRATDRLPGIGQAGGFNKMKFCRYCGARYPEDAITCPIDGNALDDSRKAHISPTKATSRRASCPACGTAGDYTPVVQLRSSFSWIAFLAGGLFAVIFRNAGRPKRVRCNKCQGIFEVRTPLSKVFLIIFWLLISPAIVYAILLAVSLLRALISS